MLGATTAGNRLIELTGTWPTVHQQLALAPLPHWKDAGAYGLPGGKSYETCLQIHDAAASGQHSAGLSYDLKKCFDAIPIRLALAV